MKQETSQYHEQIESKTHFILEFFTVFLNKFCDRIPSITVVRSYYLLASMASYYIHKSNDNLSYITMKNNPEGIIMVSETILSYNIVRDY
jgi:TorA maturation chaperone TorD